MLSLYNMRKSAKKKKKEFRASNFSLVIMHLLVIYYIYIYIYIQYMGDS